MSTTRVGVLIAVICDKCGTTVTPRSEYATASRAEAHKNGWAVAGHRPPTCCPPAVTANGTQLDLCPTCNPSRHRP